MMAAASKDEILTGKRIRQMLSEQFALRSTGHSVTQNAPKTDLTVTIHLTIDASEAKRELASLERIVESVRAAAAEAFSRKPNPQ